MLSPVVFYVTTAKEGESPFTDVIGRLEMVKTCLQCSHRSRDDG